MCERILREALDDERRRATRLLEQLLTVRRRLEREEQEHRRLERDLRRAIAETRRDLEQETNHRRSAERALATRPSVIVSRDDAAADWRLLPRYRRVRRTQGNYAR
jgi:hypothetical protein